MDLWIRSQDKLALTKINSIGIEYDKKLIGYGNACIKLGEYTTKERAIEVLDEIQSKISNLYLCKIKPMVKTGDARMVKEYLEENYIGDFIMTDSTMDIEPINKDVVIYKMPEK